MTMRSLLFTASALALGAALIKSMSGRTLQPRTTPAAPQAPAPAEASAGPAGPDDHADLLSDGAPAPSALEAGMPRDRHSDADEVRPGFADYARGA